MNFIKNLFFVFFLAILINVIYIGGNTIYAKYNGDVKYIEHISWRPFQIAYQLGETVSFIFQKLPTIHLNQLEFRLNVLDEHTKHWIALPWENQESLKYTVKSKGIIDLQIDIRKRDENRNQQSVYLGQFFVNDKSEKRDPLLRQLLAHHPNIAVPSSVLDASVAKEAYLVSYLLYWQYLGYSIEQKLDAAHQLKAYPVHFSNNKMLTYTNDHEHISVDLDKNTISNDSVLIDADLALHPNIKRIFELTKNNPAEIQIASVVTFLLYNHYIYSQVPHLFSRPWLGLRDSRGMCLLISLQLSSLLTKMGYEVNALALKLGKNSNTASRHSLVEIVFKNKYYLLDATLGDITLPTTKSLVETKKFEKFIEFPQLWNANGLLSEPVFMASKINRTEIELLH